MSSLVLKEISASNPADQASLELFAQFREHVVRVSATHLLPHHIAVTTKNGFIELINASDGEFRLFLTHLDHIPLDASLRCFALVPSLYAASASSSSSSHRPQHYQHHLVYSLSYSNEVLLANMDTGVVRTLTTCVSRPSLVECDGDYIACGEGVGTVSVWRGSAELGARQSSNNNNNSSSGYYYAGSSAMGSSLPPLLWQRAVFEDTVTCLGLHRDQLICCSADFQCAVVSVEDGSLRATLSPGIDRAVAAFALPRPSPSFPQQQPSQQQQQQAMAVCLASRIAVFAPRQPPLEVGTEGRKGAVQPPSSASVAAAVAVAVAPPDSSGGLEQWSYQGACAVGEDEVTCATCLGAYMAAGTQSGLVLLFSCDASSAGATQRVAELVRFNVGYGVRGIQLFRNDTLLVVTTAGDVWRWPLEDLLGTARPADDSRGEGEREEEEEDGPAPVSVAPPQPSAAPGVDATALSAPLAPAAAAAAATATPNEVSYTQEGDAAEDRNLSAQDISPPAAAAATNTHGTPSHVGAGGDEGTDSQQFEIPAAGGGALTSVHLSSLPGHDDSAAAVSESEENEEKEEEVESSRGGSGGRGGGRADMEDSLGTDALATQPATTLSLPAPPLQLSGKEKPAASAAASSSPDRRTTRERAALYDPDASVSEKVEEEEEEEEERGVVGRASNAAVPSASVEESHLDSPSLLSPPSSADTTAHVESNAAVPRQAREASDTHGSAEGSARDGSRGLPSSSPTSAAAAATTHERGRRRTAQSSPTAAAAARTETPEMAQLEEEFDQAMARLLGAQPAIEGLRSGRRMDPRKVANILNNVTNQHSPGATPQSPSSTSLGGLNSTKLLEQHRAALEDQDFDFEAFRSTHRLEVDALQYRHPVKALAYTRQDRVFRDVTDGTSLSGGAGRAIEKGATTRAITSGAAAEDELRDVTYGRVKPVVNAAVAEERLRGGPELLQHHCEDLLCPPLDHSCTVLFQEEALRPSTAWEEVLLLPMPLPPASSVF